MVIVTMVKQHPDWRLWQYREEIAEKTGVFSEHSKSVSISVKIRTDIKKTFRSEKVVSEAVPQERVDFWQGVKRYSTRVSDICG